MEKESEIIRCGDKLEKRNIIVTTDHVPFEDLANYLVKETESKGCDDGFYTMNMERTITVYKKWCELLPRVRPFYAIKCNPDEVLVRQLHLLGTGFDCASKEEIQLALRAGSKASDIIYAHPCKRPAYISFSAKCGVSKMTFDSKEELFKIKELYPDAEAVFRLRPAILDAGFFDCNGSKYGATAESWTDILAVAKDLDVNVIGVSFHVGCRCLSETAFEQCIQAARCIFDQADKFGFSFYLLDIGGGFTGKDSQFPFFEKICHAINLSLEQHFPVSSGIQIIAEPGTYFACSPYTLITHVTTVKEITKKEMQSVENPPISFTKNGPQKGFMYYIDDGVYGSFSSLLYRSHEDHEGLFIPKFLKEVSNDRYPSCIWGEYLSAEDLIIPDCRLPKLSVGDCLYFEEMGDYRSSTASNFNGFTAQKHTYYFITMETWKKMNWKKEDFSSHAAFLVFISD